MGECICNSCRNLKGVVNDQGKVEEYECVHGFPSDACENCTGEECEAACSHYVQDTGEDEEVALRCASCGKELKQVGSGGESGEVYCVDCYLKNC